MVSRITATPVSPLAGEVSRMVVRGAGAPECRRKNRAPPLVLRMTENWLLTSTGSVVTARQRVGRASASASSSTRSVALPDQVICVLLLSNTRIDKDGAP